MERLKVNRPVKLLNKLKAECKERKWFSVWQKADVTWLYYYFSLVGHVGLWVWCFSHDLFITISTSCKTDLLGSWWKALMTYVNFFSSNFCSESPSRNTIMERRKAPPLTEFPLPGVHSAGRAADSLKIGGNMMGGGRGGHQRNRSLDIGYV